MPSLLAWLDHSEEEQRRMRELVALFAQEESRDELGIGAIRDAFSDRLFPGVSVIQTRARYLLFVPWIFREAERRRLSGADLKAWTDKRERRLIPALKRGGDVSGLVGRVAGAGVKILPSTIYWTALQTYGIARHQGTLDQALRAGARLGAVNEADELAERSPGLWHPTLPGSPDGFFSFESARFELTSEEAGWVVERIIDRIPDSMLGQLVLHGFRPSGDSIAPWDNPFVGRLPAELQLVLKHARLFSLAIHGAALTYNLLLARRAAELDFDRAQDWSEHYRDALERWGVEVAAEPDLVPWDRTEFWSVVRATNPNVAPPTMAWVNAWLDRVADGAAARGAEDPGVCALVARREQVLKGSKSRLVNDRLLAAWKGASGTDRLVYRWGTVKTQLLDLFDGLEPAGAGA